MRTEKSNIIRNFRILAVCGTIALAIGTGLNITTGADYPESLLYPYTETITPIINGLCTVLGCILIFFPLTKWLIITILLIQSVYDVLTGFYLMGIFIYSFFALLLFSWGMLRSHFKLWSAIITGGWLLVLSTLIFSYGFDDFCLAFGVSLFAIASYLCVYNLLYQQLHFLVDSATSEAALTLPPSGSILDLSTLNLTERQIACIHYTLESSKNYREISKELSISESAIKKDMQDLFRLFGVRNREMLRLQLLQYRISDGQKTALT